MSKNKSPFRSGFVTIVGRPNVGKSTLLNQMIGQKIAIMSDKPQTTRNKIQAVYTSDEAQIVFIDTPGIHKPKSKLGDYMVQAATSTLNEVDLVLFLIDVSEEIGGGDRFIMKQFENVSTPVYCVMNKIDLVHPEKLLEIIDTYRAEYPFAEFIPVSAKLGNNVSTLIEQIVKVLPEGPRYYPDDQITDHPEQFIIAELIREKLLHATFDEVPHSLADAGGADVRAGQWRCLHRRGDLRRTRIPEGHHHRQARLDAEADRPRGEDGHRGPARLSHLPGAVGEGEEGLAQS